MRVGQKAWNKNGDLSDHSKGFFPTEMAFSTPMILKVDTVLPIF